MHFLSTILLCIVVFLHQSTMWYCNQTSLLSLSGYWLTLHANKCSFMLITQKHLHSIPPPRLFINPETELSQVNSVKYLGIQITTDMSWSTHITNICSKTRKFIGLMYRQFHLCKPETALKLYNAFIRPHMEYASIMWDPYHCKDIQMLENTQKFALRTCFKDWSSQYTDLLEHASLPSLASHRKQAKLCHPVFKITHGLTDCQCAPVIFKRPLYNTRQFSNLSLQDISVNTSQFLYSFYPHSIFLWNSLPLNHQMLTTLYSFKTDHCLSSSLLSLIKYTIILLSVVYLFTPWVPWVIMLCISSCYSC